jgi:hypothetical protein
MKHPIPNKILSRDILSRFGDFVVYKFIPDKNVSRQNFDSRHDIFASRRDILSRDIIPDKNVSRHFL